MPVFFLTYPWEVRNAVYQACAATIKNPYTNRDHVIELSCEARAEHPLAHVCRQVRNEWQSVAHIETQITTDLTHCGDADYVEGWANIYEHTRLPKIKTFYLSNLWYSVGIELDHDVYTVDVDPQVQRFKYMDDPQSAETPRGQVRKAERKIRDALEVELRVNDDGDLYMSPSLLNRIVDGMDREFDLEYEYLYEVPSGRRKKNLLFRNHLHAASHKHQVYYKNVTLAMVLESMEAAGGEDKAPLAVSLGALW